MVEPSDGHTQFILTLLVLSFNICLHLSLLPFADRFANDLETAELALLIMILGVGSWFIGDRDFEGIDREKAQFLGGIMLCCILLCILFIAAVFVYVLWALVNPQKAQKRSDRAVGRVQAAVGQLVDLLRGLEEEQISALLRKGSYVDHSNILQAALFVVEEGSGVTLTGSYTLHRVRSSSLDPSSPPPQSTGPSTSQPEWTDPGSIGLESWSSPAPASTAHDEEDSVQEVFVR